MVEGVERPVAFFSRVLNPAQRNYCPTRRELLAVVAALQHFRHYLLGNWYANCNLVDELQRADSIMEPWSIQAVDIFPKLSVDELRQFHS